MRGSGGGGGGGGSGGGGGGGLAPLVRLVGEGGEGDGLQDGHGGQDAGSGEVLNQICRSFFVKKRPTAPKRSAALSVLPYGKSGAPLRGRRKISGNRCDGFPENERR